MIAVTSLLLVLASQYLEIQRHKQISMRLVTITIYLSVRDRKSHVKIGINFKMGISIQENVDCNEIAEIIESQFQLIFRF